LLSAVSLASVVLLVSAARGQRVDIVWDKTSLVQVCADQSGYARMITLGGDSLLCIYESRGAIKCSVSSDRGRRWQPFSTVAAPEPGINMAAPDVISLKDHSLLAAYNPRPDGHDTTKRFSIRTRISYDGGRSWTDERTLYTASYLFDDGCWEPAPMVMPSGKIGLFFSNEGIYTHSAEQNISLLRSSDAGKTWSAEPEIVSFRPQYRDGMPTPIVLQGTGDVLFSIEDNYHGQFKPSIIWMDGGRSYNVVPGIPDSVYAGAPFLRQLHSGETILSYQTTLHRVNKWQLSAMMVAVGNEACLDFHNVTPPFDVPLTAHGLWNSLCILPDDTIIGVTSTDAYGTPSSVWMIKGRLVRR